MAERVICSFGRQEDKSGKSITCGGNIHARDEYTEENLRLLRIRSQSKIYKRKVCDIHHNMYISSYAKYERFCCNPFGTHGEESKVKAKGLITLPLREKFKKIGYKLIPGKRLCVACSTKMYAKLKGNDVDVTDLVISSPSVQSSQTVTATPEDKGDKGDSDFEMVSTPSSLESINNFLEANNETAINLQKLKSQTGYLTQQLEKCQRALSKCADLPVPICDIAKWEKQSQLFDEYVSQLKTVVDSSPSTSRSVLALSVLPRSWPSAQISRTFGVSKGFVRKVKGLVDENGFLYTPNKKEGRKLSEETIQAVKEFYYRQDVSKELTGKNNTVSVKEADGKRVQKGKRLLLGNILAFHQEFSEKFPNLKISPAKFAALRPKECMLASSAGMHNVCVCTYHENPKLMFDAARLKNFTVLTSVTDCLKYLVCPDPTPECWLRNCDRCPDWSRLRELLENGFDSEMVDEVTYNQWETADRGELSTFTKSVEDFNDIFLMLLEELATHHFIFKQQANYFTDLQTELKEGEVLIVGDFAENYTFVVQDSIQGHYFRQKQATIHPFSVYYVDPESKQTKQISYAAISDCMNHSTVSFYAFQRQLLEAIKSQVPFVIVKVYYFSDGCGGQYKNRCSAANTWFHEKDFSIQSEWHFFATSHGRSACDGIGGTIKKLATLYSKQHTEAGAQITTPLRLFGWAQDHIKGIKFLWVPKEEVADSEKFLEMRFSTAYAVEGIKSSHCILPIPGQSKVLIKKYSAAPGGVKKEICVTEGTGVAWSDIKGFVTFFSQGATTWSYGYAEAKFEEYHTVKIIKLKLKEGKKYDYEFSDEYVVVMSNQVLSVTEPRITSQGRNVKLLAAEAKIADAALKKVLSK